MSIDFLSGFAIPLQCRYFSDTFIGPEILLPFRIIEWLSQDQADEFLSFNGSQNIYQCA